MESRTTALIPHDNLSTHGLLFGLQRLHRDFRLVSKNNRMAFRSRNTAYMNGGTLGCCGCSPRGVCFRPSSMGPHVGLRIESNLGVSSIELGKRLGRIGFGAGLVGPLLFYATPPFSFAWESGYLCPWCPYIDPAPAARFQSLQRGLTIGLLSGLLFAAIGFCGGTLLAVAAIAGSSKPPRCKVSLMSKFPVSPLTRTLRTRDADS